MRSHAHLTLNHEGSAWTRQAVADRLAMIDALGINTTDTVVVAPLVRVGTPGSREDRTCDRCGVFVPPGLPFFPFALYPRPDVHLVGGFCAACERRENGGGHHV